MLIGLPKEIKNHEYRVGLTDAGVHELILAGHEVLVETEAGRAAGIPDEAYIEAGAKIAKSAEDVWGAADMIVKVKEPIAQEYPLLRKDQLLFTYLHMAADKDLTEAVLKAGTTSIAYETVQMPDRSLPLLAPMSMIAGRLATQVAAYHLMAPQGGKGLLMGGIPGTGEANVLVVGGGVVGEQAAIMARGLHANVTIMDINLPRLAEISRTHQGDILTRFNTKLDMAEQVAKADVVIGSVLIPGKKAPKLVSDEMVASMKPGSVLVDVAIDQGGCFENSRPTTHDDPVYQVHDAVYYCVANMPGAVPVTATAGLTNATLPYVLKLARLGWREACRQDAALAKGLHTVDGALVQEGVGEAHGIDVLALDEVLAD